MIKVFNWIKEKLIYFLVGGVALASTVAIIPDKPIEQIIVKDVATYFAELDKDNNVLRVIVADQDFINTGKVGNPDNWKQTYYNGEVRKNYAGIGYNYDKTLDAFISKKPTLDAILDEETAKWVMPVKEIVIDTNVATTTK